MRLSNKRSRLAVQFLVNALRQAFGQMDQDLATAALESSFLVKAWKQAEPVRVLSGVRQPV